MKTPKTKNKKTEQKNQSTVNLSPEEREAKAAAKRGNKVIDITENKTDDSFNGQVSVSMARTEIVPNVPVVTVPAPKVRKVNRGRENVSIIETPDKAQSDEWQFDVVQENLHTSQGKASGIFAVVRQDSGEVIGQYKGAKVLPYADLVGTFEQGLNDNGLKFERSIITTKGGARMFGRYKLDVLKVSGESFGSELRLQSSHDGSLTPGFSYSAERLACLNAMMIMSQVFAMFKKHSERFDLSFIAANIVNALQGGQTYLAETVDRMAAIQIDNGQARNVLSNVCNMGAKVGVSPRSGYLIHHNWLNPSADEQGQGNTLWRLYNAATRYTRDVDKVGRFELSRKSNLYITGAFDLAARRSNDLEKLLATPAQPLDFDRVTVNN